MEFNHDIFSISTKNKEFMELINQLEWLKRTFEKSFKFYKKSVDIILFV